MKKNDKNPKNPPSFLSPKETTEVPKPVFDKDGRLVPASELERRKKAKLWLPAQIATAKEGLPKCPEGWDAAKWFECQCHLKKWGVPTNILRRIKEGRVMNIFMIASQFPSNTYTVYTWKEILDHLGDEEWLSRILIWNHFKSAKGKL